MITCKQDTSRRYSCDNCNRTVPVILQYKFIDVDETDREYGFATLTLCEDCSNALSKLHSNVMENGTAFKYVEDEIKEFEEEVQIKDKAINLCDTCKFEIPSCKATEEGVDFKFGHGIGNDNVYECKIYELESEEI